MSNNKPIKYIDEKVLFKKGITEWLMDHWKLYASESKGKEKIKRIRFWCNGFGEFKINEFPSDHNPDGKIIYQGKDIDKAINAWFNLKD